MGAHHRISWLAYEESSLKMDLFQLTYCERAQLSQFCCTFDATILCCMTLESSLCQNKFENTHLWDINLNRKLALDYRPVDNSGLADPFPLIQIDKPALVAKFSSIQLFGWALVKHIISKETILLWIQNLLWTVFWSFITCWWSLPNQLNFELRIQEFYRVWY